MARVDTVEMMTEVSLRDNDLHRRDDEDGGFDKFKKRGMIALRIP